MQSRTIARNVQIIALLGTSIALIAGAAIYSAHASIGQPSAPKQAASPASEVLSSEDHRGSNASAPAVRTTHPSMFEILQSAQALANAGLLPPDQPPLIEVLASAQALADAGLLPPQEHPPLIEILQSAQALANAGLLPAQAHTPLIEILQAADALAKAVLLPPSDGQPSMLEILTAVNLLAEAGARPEEQVEAPPPQAPIELPPPVLAPAPTPAPPPPAPVVPTASGWYDDAYIARVLGLVNAQRSAAGLPPVAVETHLVRSAADYAKVLSDNHWFSHTGPDGRTFIQRIEAAGLPFTVPFGEILAWGTQSWSSESLVQAWMNSPPHRSEILSPLYRRAGASCYFTPADGVTVYCVIDFAG